MTTDKSLNSSSVFDAYAAYYDLLYQDKDYEGEAEYIDQLVQKHYPGARTILELGSGTGKHARLLAKKGYIVHGVERSEEMLCIARGQNEKTEENDHADVEAPVFSQGDIRDIRLDDKFDVVISLFHVMSYMTSNADVAATFATAHEHLNDKGVFVFDCWYGPAVLNLRPDVRVKRMENGLHRLTRIAEPNILWRTNLVNVHYDVFVENKGDGSIQHVQENHLMRYLFEPEVIMNCVGMFQELGVEGWMTGREPNENAWGVVYTLAKI